MQRMLIVMKKQKKSLKIELRNMRKYSTLIEKNTTILQNRSNILQKRNKYSAYNDIVNLW